MGRRYLTLLPYRVLRITVEDDSLAEFRDASSVLIMKDILAPFPNLARLEIDWTHLSYIDSRLGFIQCLQSGAVRKKATEENPVAQFSRIRCSYIPTHAIPSLTSLQIKTRFKAWQRKRYSEIEEVDRVQQPLAALEQIHMPNIRNLHWTHSYEYEQSEGLDWANALSNIAEKKWPLESLTLCLIVEDHQLSNGAQRGSVLVSQRHLSSTCSYDLSSLMLCSIGAFTGSYFVQYH